MDCDNLFPLTHLDLTGLRFGRRRLSLVLLDVEMEPGKSGSNGCRVGLWRCEFHGTARFVVGRRINEFYTSGECQS